jgi:hypothetical protein
MKVVITDTFIDSLNVLANSENPWHWRYYKNLYYDWKMIFWAKRKYRKIVKEMKPWDYGSILLMLKFQLEILSHQIETKGLEVDEDRLPKVERMKRCVKLLDHKIEDDYAERCGYEDSDMEFVETETGFEMKPEDEETRRHNTRVFKEAHEMEEKEWKELFELLKDLRSWWD